MKQEQRAPGLSSILERQRQRRRRRRAEIPGRAALWFGLILAVWAVLYYKKTQADLESHKARLFAKQREIATRIGPKFEPTRDRIEAWTLEAAKEYEGDFIADEAKTWDFTQRPGIYLRLRLEDADSVEAIREAANDSLRDGFSACLFRLDNPDPTSGPACKLTRDCAEGTFCNEFERCTRATQPYNMRTAYRGTRILSEEWTIDLRTTTNDLRLRLLEEELATSEADDVPLAVDLVAQAEFFLLVLDEPSSEGEGVEAEALQALPHSSRIFVWKFSEAEADDQLLLRMRRAVDARLIATGSGITTATAESLAAQRRQANSCQLALEVRQAIGRAGE